MNEDRMGGASCQNSEMILELAILNVKADSVHEFEVAFAEAQHILAAMPGYRGHELRECVEKPHQYLLLVHWQTLEDHTVGFRQSPDYQRWRQLLHHFYEPFPEVEHYRAAFDFSPS